ncbi:hypothetical protein GQR58_021014 [Nymphon striatum]|nr:hypothetical protein GQR58_021014 [Nymphon striatum]
MDTVQNEYLIGLKDNIILKLYIQSSNCISGNVIRLVKPAKDDCQRKLSVEIGKKLILYQIQENVPDSEIKNFVVKRLHDSCSLMQNIYALVCLKYTTKINKYVLLSVRFQDCNNIYFDHEDELQVSSKTDVVLRDGPVFCWKYEDCLKIHSPIYSDTSVKVEKECFVKFSGSCVQKSKHGHGYSVAYTFFFSDLNNQTRQVKVVSFDDEMKNSIIEGNKIPNAYVEIMTCVRPISTPMCELLFSYEKTIDTEDTPSFLIICTKNKQCLIFQDKIVISFCSIPFSSVTCIQLYQTSCLSILYIILLTSENNVCALKYCQQSQGLMVEKCWNNISSVVCGNFFLDGINRLLLVKNEDPDFKEIIVTDFTEVFSNEDTTNKVQCDQDVDGNTNSVIHSIQTKFLEMQMLESDVEQELTQKKVFKEIINAQIKTLNSGNESTPSHLDCSFVYLVEPKENQVQKCSNSEQYPLSVDIFENSWKIIQRLNYNIIASVDIENNSEWVVDNIQVSSSVTQEQARLIYRLIKLDLERNWDSSKRQKFEDSKCLLAPGQHGKLGIMLDMSDHKDLDLNMSVLLSVSWTANDIRQQKDMIFNVDVISTNPSSVCNSEVFVDDLCVINAFQIQTSLLLISLHSNLSCIYSILTACSTFKFKTRIENNLLFSHVHNPGIKDQTITLKILSTENHQAKCCLFTSGVQDIMFVVKKLYEDPEFPTDIIIITDQPDTKYLKQKVLLNIKSELSYVYNLNKNLFDSTETNPGSSSKNINIIDTIRQSFHATQQDLHQEIIFTATDYEKFLSDFRKLQVITDADVSELCDIENM